MFTYICTGCYGLSTAPNQIPIQFVFTITQIAVFCKYKKSPLRGLKKEEFLCYFACFCSYNCAKSTGCIVNVGNPDSDVNLVINARTDGNNNVGTSINSVRFFASSSFSSSICTKQEYVDSIKKIDLSSFSNFECALIIKSTINKLFSAPLI